MKNLLGVLLLLGFASRLLAADMAGEFTAANELYAQGKFGEAAAAYEKILHAGGQSPVVLFNYGNAEFKAGNSGKAIVAYREATLLAPRDAELRANLAFVRSQVQGVTLHESKWQKWIGSLTLNEGALLTAVLFWAMFGLFIVRQIQPTLAPKLRSATRATVALTIFSTAILGLQAHNHFNSSIAVVTGPEATARNSPFDDAPSAFTVHDGAELRVLDRHDDWVQVDNGLGKVGWLNQKQVAVLPEA